MVIGLWNVKSSFICFKKKGGSIHDLLHDVQTESYLLQLTVHIDTSPHFPSKNAHMIVRSDACHILTFPSNQDIYQTLIQSIQEYLLRKNSPPGISSNLAQSFFCMKDDVLKNPSFFGC